MSEANSPSSAAAEKIGSGVASRSRRTFTDEFRQSAVRLVVAERYSFAAAAEAVNVGQKSLRDWYAKFAPKPTPCGEDATVDELREENKRLATSSDGPSWSAKS